MKLSRLVVSCLLASAFMVPIVSLGLFALEHAPERAVVQLAPLSDIVTASIVSDAANAVVSLLALLVIAVAIHYALERFHSSRLAARRQELDRFYDAWRLPDPGGG